MERSDKVNRHDYVTKKNEGWNNNVHRCELKNHEQGGDFVGYD